MSNRAIFVGRQPPRTPTPTLKNPFGARMNSLECSVISGPGAPPTSTMERLETPMTPAQLLDHFGKQLADSGWVPSASPPTVRQIWTHADSGGTTRQATLQITPSASAAAGAVCQELLLSVRQIPRTPLAPRAP